MKIVHSGFIALLYLLISCCTVTGYQYVGDKANCLLCHENFSSGSQWHAEHQLFSGDCSACHTDDYTDSIPTSTCAACHAEQPCSWVQSHEESPDFTGVCSACHQECSENVDDDADDGCGDTVIYEGPCLIIVLVGEHDYRTVVLETYRDTVLSQTPTGRFLVRSYYRYEHILRSFVRNSPAAENLFISFLTLIAHFLI